MFRSISLIFVIPFLMVFSWAQEKTPVKKTGKKESSQTAIIRNSGAAVYKELSFDSDTIGYLEEGEKVKISRKKYPGKDGFGLFFKVITANKLKGYIADVDVIPKYTKTKFSKKIKENPQFEDYDKPKKEENKEPMLFTRYFGAQLAYVDYTEIFSGQKLHAQTPMYGLKLTGPGFLIEEVPLDIDILLAIAPPAYYDNFLATAPSSGVFIITNLALKIPFIDSPNSIIYYSLGLTGGYTKFTIPIGSTNLDSQELKIGVIGGLGAATRFNYNYFFQVDARYYYEKTQYMGYSASFGFQY